MLMIKAGFDPLFLCRKENDFLFNFLGLTFNPL